MPQRSYPTYEQWPIDKLVQAVRQGADDGAGIGFGDKTLLRVPRFQRSIVWGDEQKRQLIVSIFNGFPIGSLLLHERKEGQAAIYQLVDGLQRTTTITDYMERPLVLAPVGELLETTEVAKIATQLGAQHDEIRVAIADWAEERRKPDPVNDYDWYSLASHLIMKSSAEIDQGSLKEPCQSLLGNLQKQVSIGDVILPVVIYRGPDEHLPDIFERINSQGTQLSKYEVFAASWFGTRVRVANPKVRDAVEAKYEELRRNGFALGDAEITIQEDSFTLFEYLFGLGRIMAEYYPEVFDQPTSPTDTVPAAFVAATVAHGLRISSMSKLAGRFPKEPDGSIDPATFEEALLESCEQVAERLRPVLRLRLNRRSTGYDIAHSQNQVLSLVVRYMVGQFDPDSDWAPRHDGDGAEVLAHVRSHYLYDILGRVWRGSGDNRLYDRVWQSGEQSEELRPSTHYTAQLSEEQWRDRLRTWFDEQLLKQQRSRAYVRSEDRLFLRYVYAKIVNVFDDQGEVFDIEHLIPVARLQRLIPTSDVGWPISCVANLALFEQALNREKSAKTISEYIVSQPEDKRNQAAERVAKYVIKPSPLEVDVKKDGDGNDAMTLDDYVGFLRHRFEAMVDHVLEIVLPN